MIKKDTGMSNHLKSEDDTRLHPRLTAARQTLKAAKAEASQTLNRDALTSGIANTSMVCR
jgi:hypothetical protein